MGGFGTGSYGLGPFGFPTPPEAVEQITTAVSCRLIDPVLRDYVTDANGNPVADDGTADRVYLLLSYADAAVPDVITPQALLQRQSDIEDALSVLLTGPTPAISDLVVTVTDEGGGSVYGEVSYFNLLTQTAVTLQILPFVASTT
jgi:hypothetical protein